MLDNELEQHQKDGKGVPRAKIDKMIGKLFYH
jgi:hypothetical protein